MSDSAQNLHTLSDDVKSSWHRFLDVFEPMRPELYRYCRHLTRSPWDAEDLAQDALMRAFVTLGTMFRDLPNPRAWLFRVASWVLVFWYEHDQGPMVRTVMTVETDGDRIAHVRNYFFTPDVIAEICAELGLPYRVNGYRYWHEGA